MSEQKPTIGYCLILECVFWAVAIMVIGQRHVARRPHQRLIGTTGTTGNEVLLILAICRWTRASIDSIAKCWLDSAN